MKNYLLIFILIGIGLSCQNKKTANHDDLFYTCSMDPQVVSDRPGSCPICGMPLTPVKKSSVRNSDDIELSDQQIQLGNILVDSIGKTNIQSKIELTGTLGVDASKTTSVSARVMGRIEKLYIKTTGDFISRGAPLYELYSETLNNAKQEYIAAIERRNQFKDHSLLDFDNLIEGAKKKLQLWGLTENQIKALEQEKQASVTTTFYSKESGYVTSLEVTEGSYVMEGGTVLQLTDLSTLWAEAQVYTSQLYQIPDGASASVVIPGFNKSIRGAIEFANPEVELQSRINFLRVVIQNQQNQLKPGMAVVVEVETANRNNLTLPTDAIIRDARGATVWIQTGANKFKSRMVTTGLESDGLTEIISGLQTGDVVVTSGAYLLHSEFIFKRGNDPMAGHDH